MSIKITAFALSFCIFPLMIAMNKKSQEDLDKQLLEAIYGKKDKQIIKKLVKAGANFNNSLTVPKGFIGKAISYLRSQPTTNTTTILKEIMYWKRWYILPYLITQRIDLEAIHNYGMVVTNYLSDATKYLNNFVIEHIIIAGAQVRSSQVLCDPLAAIQIFVNDPDNKKNVDQYKLIQKISELYTVIDKMPKFANEFEKYEALITYKDQFIPFNRILFSLFTNDDLKQNGLYSEISRFNTIKFKEFIKNYDNKIIKEYVLENSEKNNDETLDYEKKLAYNLYYCTPDVCKKTLAYELYFNTSNYLTFALFQQNVIEILPDIFLYSNVAEEFFDLEERKELTKCLVGKKMSNFVNNYDCIFKYL